MLASTGYVLMNTTQHTTTRFALMVMIFCYSPQIMQVSWWISLLILGIIVYRLLADYVAWPLPGPAARLLLILLGITTLLLKQQGNLWSGTFFINFLLVFIALKSLEVHTTRDLRVLILCHFYLILTVILLNLELWIFIYLLLAVFANFLLMLKVTSPAITFKQSAMITTKHLFLALPVSMILFYLFPRLTNPLWQVPAMTETRAGFHEELTLNNMNDLFNDDSKIMRITFQAAFKPDLYWRGLVLSRYDGWRWTGVSQNDVSFTPLQKISRHHRADYQILLEPHQKKWLFYQDNPVASSPTLLYSPETGLTQVKNRVVSQRFIYSIATQKPTYRPLSRYAYHRYTQLPKQGNPKLRAWARQQFAAAHGDTNALINRIRLHIHQQPYWYSLNAGDTPKSINQMDQFWFESRKGYCEYYASSVAFILRSVGIPARIVVGYFGGNWNPIVQYLTIQQNNAHAWLEYWQEGKGWQRFDPTLYISVARIDKTIWQQQANRYNPSWFFNWGETQTKLSWTTRMMFLLESAQFFWERWLLFYNYDNQQNFLRHIGFKDWDGMRLLQISVMILVFFLLVGSLCYQLSLYNRKGPLSREHQRLLREIKRLGIATTPPATLHRQIHELIRQRPTLSKELTIKYNNYEQTRLKNASRQPDQHKRTIKSIKSLRESLQKIKI
ncbi:transglutaminaseTgpA domain-containing protein [Legionella spiritensis]|uniref:Transglutaminase n=2 Tax=Legionella spiritensis TaxID=452 RepID=A0A0W0Z8Z5_LEGSP|nr:DUF3488 and transglutaminase-like domain-containing protein [Legionella spiritensis]KTD65530.1 transglutaminase [Legionella spiritensis]SNV44653.1 transglutaminase domain-containing protein [Legionella spiritensis]